MEVVGSGVAVAKHEPSRCRLLRCGLLCRQRLLGLGEGGLGSGEVRPTNVQRAWISAGVSSRETLPNMEQDKS